MEIAVIVFADLTGQMKKYHTEIRGPLLADFVASTPLHRVRASVQTQFHRLFCDVTLGVERLLHEISLITKELAKRTRKIKILIRTQEKISPGELKKNSLAASGISRNALSDETVLCRAERREAMNRLTCPRTVRFAMWYKSPVLLAANVLM